MRLNKNTEKIMLTIFSVFLFFLSIFSRSFIGIYIFGFRVGEIIIGISVVSFIFCLIFYRKLLIKQLNLGAYLLMSIILFYSLFFIIPDLVDSTFSLYVIRSSTFIWTIFFLFVGLYIRSTYEINEKVSNFLIFLSLIIYIIQVEYFPRLVVFHGIYKSMVANNQDVSSFESGSVLLDFFINYSDKFEPYKGTDLLIFIVLILSVSNRVKNNTQSRIYFFLIISSLYLPVFFIKSRSATACFFLYIIIEIIKYRKFVFNLKIKTVLVFIISIITLLLSSYNQFNSEYDINESQEIIYSLVTQRTPELSGKFIEIVDGRIYSGDGNLDWRLQIWQDVLFDLEAEQSLLTGYGYKDKIPAMDRRDRKGSGLVENEHVHNYFINLIARGGLVMLILYLILYFQFFKILKLSNSYSIIFIISILILASLFDSSMENVRYPLMLYLFIGYSIADKKD